MSNTLKQPASDGGTNTIAHQTLLGEEWGRLPKPRARFNGLSRTTLLEACERGDIRSCVIKKRNAIRGIRLIYLPSLYEYLERLASETMGDSLTTTRARAK